MRNNEKQYLRRQWSPTTERNASIGVAVLMAAVVLMKLFVGPAPRTVWEQRPEASVLASR